MTYPSPSPFPFGNHNFIFYVCGSVFVVWISPVVLLLASTCKWWLFFSTWITQYSHRLAANVIISRVVFLWFSALPLCVCPLHLYPPLCWWTRRPRPCLAVEYSSAANTGVHVSFQIRVLTFPECMSRSGTAGSYGSTVFNFLRSLHTVLHSGRTDSEKEITLVRFLWVFWQCGQILDGGNLRKFNSRGMEIK